MVYYQSMPLIVKTEQPQTQFCTPLSNGTSITTSEPSTSTGSINHSQLMHQPHHQHQYQQSHSLQASAPNYQINNISSAVSAHQQYPTSLKNNLQSDSTQVLLRNHQAYAKDTIKSEQLPPSTLTIFTTTGSNTPCHAPSTTNNSSMLSSSSVTITPHRSNTSSQKFKCGQCGMMFGSKSAHTSHTKSHVKDDQPLDDMIIDISLGIPKKPLIKTNASGGGDPYRCNVCQKTFAVPARLIRHYRTHTGERPFECEWCHKLFSVKENLQVHRRIHTKERPYQCQVCDRAFEHSGKLHRHNRIHTGERPHGCTLCDKTFIQSGQLVIHMRTHTGEKPYKCPVEGCGKGFTCSKQLKVHSRTHTGEKPYRCDICQREFGYNHVLKLHRMQHYGSKCYKCTICDDTFKNKKEMEAHIKGHANNLSDDGRKDIATSGSSTNSSAPASPLSPTSHVQQQPYLELTQPKTSQTEGNSSVTSDTISPPPSICPISSQGTVTEEVTITPIPPSPSAPSTTITPPTTFLYETEDSVSFRNQQYITSMDTEDYGPSSNENPTDLRVLQNQHQPQPQHVLTTSCSNSEDIYQPQQLQQNDAAPYSFIMQSSLPHGTKVAEHDQDQNSQFQYHQQMRIEPTINPALLEAASIATRMSQVNIVEETDPETQAALQIMQLHRSQQQQRDHQQFQQEQQQQQQQQQHHQYTAYDNVKDSSQLVEHYKRYAAPVPKFEPSLLNNEIIVRQVEAAIAPLRASTESPERVSSPESDSNMMMADRDIMTLPLRKRKVYMSEDPCPRTSNSEGITTNIKEDTVANKQTATTTAIGANVIRMSSVIQFAKAS